MSDNSSKRLTAGLNLPRHDDEDDEVEVAVAKHWRRNLTFITFNVVLIATISLILLAQYLPLGLPTDQPSVEVGRPAPQTYYAPRDISYASAVLTAADKDNARKDPKNLAYDINSELIITQRNALQSALTSINGARASITATLSQKLDNLRAATTISLTTQAATNILSLSEPAWQDVASDSRRTLDTLMNNRTLLTEDDAKRASEEVYAFTPRSFSDQQRAAELAIVSNFLVPNRQLNEERSKMNQDAAVAAIPPHIVEVKRGQVVLTKGELVTPADVEKLEQLGIKPIILGWQDFASIAGLVTALLLLASIYLFVNHPTLWRRYRPLLLLGLSVILPTLATRFTLDHLLWPFALPFAGVGIVIAVLLTADIALVYALTISLLAALPISLNRFDLTLFYFITSMVGIYSTWKAERSSDFVRAGLYVSLVSYIVLLLLRLGSHDLDSTALLEMGIVSLTNGVLSAVFSFASFNLLGNLFGTTTPLQLLELAHPTQPLLRRLMHDAPGTYHHSLVVGNLAERAAEVVGADPLLARVGAYYHDIGKVLHPLYFVDNQAGMENIHDQLDPRDSAHIISGHVRDGIELARKYHLPRRVRDIIPQHHGTTVMRFFYERALAQPGADHVDIAHFRYPGPKPQTKEAAIVMLADSVEAATRAAAQDGKLGSAGISATQSQRFSEDAVGDIVHKVIRDKIEDGQLDECDLTIRDLNHIERAFRDMLRGVYHPRVTYPEKTLPPAQAEATIATLDNPAPSIRLTPLTPPNQQESTHAHPPESSSSNTAR